MFNRNDIGIAGGFFDEAHDGTIALIRMNKCEVLFRDQFEETSGGIDFGRVNSRERRSSEV